MNVHHHEPCRTTRRESISFEAGVQGHCGRPRRLPRTKTARLLPSIGKRTLCLRCEFHSRAEAPDQFGSRHISRTFLCETPCLCRKAARTTRRMRYLNQKLQMVPVRIAHRLTTSRVAKTLVQAILVL